MSRAGVLPNTQVPTTIEGHSPMTSTMKIREELLTCRLCSMRFQTFGKRPLALRCMHTFCEECVVSEFLAINGHNDKPRGWLSRKSTPNQLVCPICETKTPVGRDVQSCRTLPVNPAIMELLEILERTPRDTAFNGSTPAAVIKEAGLGSMFPIHHFPLDQQNQQPVSNVIIVNGDSAVVTSPRLDVTPEQCVRGEPPFSIQDDGRCSGSPAAVQFGDPDAFTGSQQLVTSVSVGSVRAMKPMPHHQLRGDNVGGIVWKSSTQQHTVNISSQGVAPSTSVHVGTAAAASGRELEDRSSVSGIVATDGQSALRYSQLCSKCHSKPASVSVAIASKMISSQLCADCAKTKTAAVRNQGSSNAPSDQSLSQNGVCRTSEMNQMKPIETVARAPDGRPEEAHTSVSGNVSDLQQKASQVFVNAGGRKGLGSSAHSTRQPQNSRSRPVEESGYSDACYSSNAGERRSPLTQLDRTEMANSRLQHAVANDVVEMSSNQGPVAIGIRYNEIIEAPPSSADTRAREKAAEATGYDEPTARNGIQMMSLRSTGRPLDSAPRIEDIHPPPRDNPPFNPNYDTMNMGTPSDWRKQYDSNNLPSYSAPPYEEFAPSNVDEKRPAISRNLLRIDGQREGITGQNVGLSFVLPVSPPQPPKYEEVMASDNGAGDKSRRGIPPTVDRSSPSDRSTGDGVRLVRSFGRYSEISTQPAGFRAPSRISTSIETTGNRSNASEVNVVITDRINATVQVFTPTGECLSMLHVDDCSGCCMWTVGDSKRLVVANDHGVQVYNINGTRIYTIQLQGFVLAVVRYKNGFIAVQSKVLSIFTGPSAVLTRAVSSKAKPGQCSTFYPFDDIRDVAINSLQDLVVLESVAGGATVVNIMTEDGSIKSTISPSHSDPCGPLKTPLSVAVDVNHNVFISAADQNGSGRIVMYGPNGRFVRHVVTPIGGSRTQMTTWPAGIAVGAEGELYAIVRGDNFAEIRLYAYI